MSRFHSYLNSATVILEQYKGDETFAAFLKKFFALHKKHGSTDRKQIAHLCYCFFRLGKDFTGIPVGETILTGLFLCSTVSNEILAAIKPEWNEKIYLSVSDKIKFISSNRSSLLPFPWIDGLSEGVESDLFCQSFLIQPHLFLRIRNGYAKTVFDKLQNAGLAIQLLSETCLALPAATKVEAIIELDKEAVVQDYSSQRIAEFLQLVRPGRSDQLKVWDCCAGSGGKSILSKDVLGDIKLTVSDVRENILINLKKRFQQAGISNYSGMIMDLSAPRLQLPDTAYELILCDAPCTGSGTWGRTPERLYFFNESEIEHYTSLQKKIVSNVIEKIKPAGYFLYITCSVFKKENEAIAAYIKEKFHLTLVKMELLKGYDKKADSMFAALFTA